MRPHWILQFNFYNFIEGVIYEMSNVMILPTVKSLKIALNNVALT